MSDEEVQVFASAVVAGDGGQAVAACAADPALALAVSRAAGRLLVDRAANHLSAVDPSLFVWPVAQQPVVALAAVPGADARTLAGALLRCCVHEAVSGEPDKLDEASLRLILDHHAEVVGQLLRRSPYELESDVLSPRWPNDSFGTTRFLVDAMWTLHGAEGARWMDILIDHHPHGIVSPRGHSWTAEDWILRLDVLTDRDEVPFEAYALSARMLDVEDPAPREAAPALARYACSRFAAGQDVARLHRTRRERAGVLPDR